MSAPKYCDDPDHCTYSDCPTAFCDRGAKHSFAAPAGSTSTDDYQEPSARDLEIQSLRCTLYQAASRYHQCVMKKGHTLEEILRLSDELENAADAWATR